MVSLESGGSCESVASQVGEPPITPRTPHRPSPRLSRPGIQSESVRRCSRRFCGNDTTGGRRPRMVIGRNVSLSSLPTVAAVLKSVQSEWIRKLRGCEICCKTELEKLRQLELGTMDELKPERSCCVCVWQQVVFQVERIKAFLSRPPPPPTLTSKPSRSSFLYGLLLALSLFIFYFFLCLSCFGSCSRV